MAHQPTSSKALLENDAEIISNKENSNNNVNESNMNCCKYEKCFQK